MCPFKEPLPYPPMCLCFLDVQTILCWVFIKLKTDLKSVNRHLTGGFCVPLWTWQLWGEKNLVKSAKAKWSHGRGQCDSEDWWKSHKVATYLCPKHRDCGMQGQLASELLKAKSKPIWKKRQGATSQWAHHLQGSGGQVHCKFGGRQQQEMLPLWWRRSWNRCKKLSSTDWI